MKMTLELLTQSVAGDGVAIRRTARLQPAGGPGDKVFPPTYVKEGRAETKYAFERRRVDGREVDTVLLDSVSSQANRIEEGLLEAWRQGEVPLPVVQVDFTGEPGLEDLDTISALQAPHRLADAILRDSELDGVPFRDTDIGRAFTDARPNDATAVYRNCPTALIFGVWDSTGPKGGLGSKFQRCLVSEIVAIDAVAGVKTASRIDPAGIENQAGPVFKKKGTEDDWTVDPEEAQLEKGKPVLFSRTKSEGKGNPSAINHGNIPPSIDREAGGITFDYAVQTSVLSLAALRKLRFVKSCAGEPFAPSERQAAETSARTALAALALAGLVYQWQSGFDLRSRSLLVPEKPASFELLGRDGSEPQVFELDRDAAGKLVAEALEQAAKKGMRWHVEPVNLKPTRKLAGLIRKSRDQTVAGEIDTES